MSVFNLSQILGSWSKDTFPTLPSCTARQTGKITAEKTIPAQKLTFPTLPAYNEEQAGKLPRRKWSCLPESQLHCPHCTPQVGKTIVKNKTLLFRFISLSSLY